MNKIIFTIILYFSLIISAKALINNYDIEMYINEDGKIHVLEAITMEPPYNGYEKNIKYESFFTPHYEETITLGTEYNFSVKIDEIMGINYNNNQTLLELYETADKFQQQESIKGSYGNYTIDTEDHNQKIKIYNSSMLNKDILISYYIEDLLIKHNDSYELLFNIFTNLTEDINKLNIKINFPIDEEYETTFNPLIFLHNLNGNYEIKNNTIHISYENITKDSQGDFRILFDSNLNIEQQTQINALDIIEIVEENIKNNNEIGDIEYRIFRQEVYESVIHAEETNNKDDYTSAINKVNQLQPGDELKAELLIRLVKLEQEIYRVETIKKVALSSIIAAWLIGLFILQIMYYKKVNSKVEIQQKKHYSIIEFYYLKYKKINHKAFICLFIDMINNKKITYKEKNNEINYTLENKELNENEEKLVKFIFGKNKKTSSTEIINNINKNKKESLINYSNWLNSSSAIGRNINIYNNMIYYNIISAIYLYLGVSIYYMYVDSNLYFHPILIIITSIIFIIYNLLFKKLNNHGKYIINNKNIFTPQINKFLKNPITQENKQIQKDIIKIKNTLQHKHNN